MGNDGKLLKEFSLERNLSFSPYKRIKVIIKQYTKFYNKTFCELIIGGWRRGRTGPQIQLRPQQRLPPIITQSLKITLPINYKDLPDHEVIKVALDVADNLMKAAILFMSTNGCARMETLNLNVTDFYWIYTRISYETDLKRWLTCFWRFINLVKIFYNIKWMVWMKW